MFNVNNHELTGTLEEYYFDDYYRVLVMRDENKYVVSVDVYHAKWEYPDYEDLCIENVCLLVKEIVPRETSIRGVEKVIVIGVKVKDKYETIGVKWTIDHKPSSDEVYNIYRESWDIARGLLAKQSREVRNNSN